MRWWGFARVLGLVICLYMVAMSLLFTTFSVRNEDFLDQAALTRGTVVALVPRAAAGSAREPGTTVRTMPMAPTVSYTVGGRTYTHTADHGRYRNRLRVGDTVPVRYLPSDPGQARLEAEGRILLPLLAGAFGLAAVGVVVLLTATRRVGAPGPPTPRPGHRTPTTPGADEVDAADRSRAFVAD